MTERRYQPVKAYKNLGFLTSSEARTIRILAEYLEPEARFRDLAIRDTIVVFGSARATDRETAEAELAEAERTGEGLERARQRRRMAEYYEATRELCRRLTAWSKSLAGTERRFVICSGGGPGIMEAANRGASEARGENIGLNVSLPFEQSGNPYITRRLAFEFHYFFMRKYWFTYLAKAMLVMPGGFGTMDELAEILTLIQTGKLHKKLPIVLFGTEYWGRVLNLDPMVEWGTISPEDVELLHPTDSIDEAFEYITGWLSENVLAPERAEAAM